MGQAFVYCEIKMAGNLWNREQEKRGGTYDYKLPDSSALEMKL